MLAQAVVITVCHLHVGEKDTACMIRETGSV